jgi:hypothetical protein
VPQDLTVCGSPGSGHSRRRRDLQAAPGQRPRLIELPTFTAEHGQVGHAADLHRADRWPPVIIRVKPERVTSHDYAKDGWLE